MGNYLALRSRVDESGVTADLTIANMIKFMIEFPQIQKQIIIMKN